MKYFYSTLIFIFSTVLLQNCSSDQHSDFPMDKKYWTPDDYTNVIYKLNELSRNEKELPNLDNPETSPVFKKIIDKQNVSVGTQDEQLGLTHRDKFAEEMFDRYKNLAEEYSKIERTDKYKYPLEFVEIEKWGLYVQLDYFKLGNEKILKESDNPENPEVKSVVNSNYQVLINNYTLYLDNVNYEERFNEKALVSFAEGIKEYFPKLINEVVPNGNYSGMLNKISNMEKKAKNPAVLQELESLKNLINSKKELPKTPSDSTATN